MRKNLERELGAEDGNGKGESKFDFRHVMYEIPVVTVR